MKLFVAFFSLLTVWPSMRLEPVEYIVTTRVTMTIPQERPIDFFTLCLNDFSRKYNKFVASYNNGVLDRRQLQDANMQWNRCVVDGRTN